MTDLVKQLAEAGVIASGYSINNGCPDCGQDSNLFAEAADLLQSQQAEIDRLREALEDIASDAAGPQRFYDSHGPQWTTPAGSEFEDTSSYLDLANSILDKARAALQEGK